MKKEIRRLIREAIKWNKVDNGMPTFWSSENYRRARRMKGLTLAKDEQHYVYYIKSERAIKEIAEKIFKIRRELEAEVFGLGNALEDYKKENRKLRKECKKWKEISEILANREIGKSIIKSLKQFNEGKGIKLKDL